jgi:tetraacyldisaccharide 4'-kinase
VISVGNLSVGGSGKTPVVAALARMLLEWGERPAILSRGYARRRGGDGVVVISDGKRLLEPVEHSGDEPQMLARALPEVPVLVCPDRYLAGRLAEHQLNCTVLLLDDGFQHLLLGRQVDVLVMPASDLDEAVLPSGRLREGLDAACSADCILVPGSDEDVARVSASFDRTPVFRVSRRYAPLRALDSSSHVVGSRVVAVAAIGRPQRFFTALREQGYDVLREVPFADHHWFTAGDLERIRATARESGADLVVTTEKDAVRLPPQPGWAVLPMTATIEPTDRFSSWLRERL